MAAVAVVQLGDYDPNTHTVSSCLIKYDGLLILCDYMHEQQQDTLPIDISTVDVVLISNHHAVASLVYLTQYTTFRGAIYATCATISLGACMAAAAAAYDAVDLEEALRRVHGVAYGQDVRMNHRSSSLVLCAVSSGYSLGACNWLLKSCDETVGVMCASSVLTNRHPRYMNWRVLRNMSMLVVKDVVPSARRASIGDRLARLCNVVQLTKRCVLIPANPTGFVYDVIEAIATSVRCHVYFAAKSDLAAESLGRANALGEWMCARRSENVYKVKTPFDFDTNITVLRPRDYEMMATEYINRKVVIVGDVEYFVKSWALQSDGALVDFEQADRSIDLPARFAMQRVHCTIDPRLSPIELEKLLSVDKMAPQRLIHVSACPRAASATATATSGWAYEPCIMNATTLKQDDATKKTIMAHGRQYSMRPIRGVLQRRDHEFRLEPAVDAPADNAHMLSIMMTMMAATHAAQSSSSPRSSSSSSSNVYDWDALVDVFRKMGAGFNDAQKLSDNNIAIPSIGASVIAPAMGGDGRVRIICDSPEHRLSITQAFLSLFSTPSSSATQDIRVSLDEI